MLVTFTSSNLTLKRTRTTTSTNNISIYVCKELLKDTKKIISFCSMIKWLHHSVFSRKKGLRRLILLSFLSLLSLRRGIVSFFDRFVGGNPNAIVLHHMKRRKSSSYSSEVKIGSVMWRQCKAERPRSVARRWKWTYLDNREKRRRRRGEEKNEKEEGRRKTKKKKRWEKMT